jgi:hypothetical protein
MQLHVPCPIFKIFICVVHREKPPAPTLLLLLLIWHLIGCVLTLSKELRLLAHTLDRKSKDGGVAAS